MSSPSSATGWGAGSLILLLVFLYFWIGIAPLADQSGAVAEAPSSNLLNQIVVVLLSLLVVVTVWGSPARGALLSPHGLLLLMLCWFCFVSLSASEPEIAFRRIVYAAIVCGCANAALLLPRTNEEFARVLAVGVTAALLLSYFAVIVLPAIGIHQSTDLSEATLAGDWRGHFGHKNAAAAAMAYAVLFGLYLRQFHYPVLGTCIIIFATIFLYFAGGKTATAMLPTVLLLAWMFEHWVRLRYVIVFGTVMALNYLLIGSAVYQPITNLLTSFDIDATFTGRTTIWAFALDAISDKPFTGYGFQSFWQSEDLLKMMTSSWATMASHSHNSFLEALINAGVPGLILMVLWLLILPVRDAGRAFKSDNDPALTRLFLRIWLFSVLLSCLENVVFVNTGPIWFTMLIGVFGMRLQSRASLEHRKPASMVKKVANA